jgi:hypothetical protein
MSKALRLSEKWFRFGLWIVAFVFASFLIGLGGTIVHNLPKVEHHYTLDDFIDKPAATLTRSEIKADAADPADGAGKSGSGPQLKLNGARANSVAARETFNNWLATRHATKRPEQDGELIEPHAGAGRTEDPRTSRRWPTSKRQQQSLLDAHQAEGRAQRELAGAAGRRLGQA